MRISIEKLVELITREVITELTKRGIKIDFIGEGNVSANAQSTFAKTSVEIDMSVYRTPVLTENNLSSLEPSISEIIIPTGTIITPGARDIIKKRKLIITHKNKSN